MADQEELVVDVKSPRTNVPSQVGQCHHRRLQHSLLGRMTLNQMSNCNVTECKTVCPESRAKLLRTSMGCIAWR